MKLIRYERPEVWPSHRLEKWFRDPFRGFRDLSSLFDADRFFNWDDAPVGTRRFGADLFEDEDNYYARFEVPGLKKKDLSIELHNAVLTVSYKHEDKEGDKESARVSAESFSRSISVPETVDPKQVGARLEDGILTVTLPKAEAEKPRSISIK